LLPKAQCFSSHADHKRLFVVFLASSAAQFAAALAFFAIYGVEVFFEPDSRTYINTALGFITTGAFSRNGLPEIIRTPGYPLFIAPFLLLRRWELVVVGVQCLLGGAVASISCGIANRLRGERAGVITAILFTIAPLTLYYSSLIMTERLSALFIALICAVMFRFLDNPRWAYAALAGVLSACAAFIRPAALYMPLGIAVFFLGWGFLTGAGYKKTAACTLLFLFCAMTPIKAWEWRNERLTGYKGFSAISAINLYFYNAAAVLAKTEGVSFSEMQDKMGYRDIKIYFEQHPEMTSLPIGVVYNKMEQDGKNIIKNNPILYSKIHLRGMLLTLIAPERPGRYIADYIARQITATRVKQLTFAIAVSFVLFWNLLSLFGVMLSLPRFPAHTLFLLGVMAYFVLISGGPAGYSRFRDPITFLLAVFAGIAVDTLLRKFGRGGRI